MRYGHLAVIPHSSHRLAQVLPFHHDSEAESLVIQSLGKHLHNVPRQPLLQLQAGGAIADHAGDFADAEDTPFRAGNVGEVIPAEERQDMMLAHRIVVAAVEHNIRHALLIGECGDLRLLRRIVASEYLFPHPHNAVGSTDQALAVGVFADGADERFQRTDNIFCVWSDSFHFGCDLM